AELMAEGTGPMVITGGSTPREASRRRAGMRDDWSDVELWFTDERCVPPDHEHSNFRMVRESLLDSIEGANVPRRCAELGPHEGAADCERALGEVFGDELPSFDFMLLG